MSRNTAATRAKKSGDRPTPTPWRFQPLLSASENHRGFVLIAHKGMTIAEIRPLDPDGSEGEANARLISTSPELLAMLKEASEHLDYCGYGDKWERECSEASKLRERIEATINKACPQSADTSLASTLTKEKK